MSKKKQISLFGTVLVLALGVILSSHLYTGKMKKSSPPAKKTKVSVSKDVAAPKKGKGKTSELEAFYNDNFGTNPVARDFDAPEGSLCGNGQSQYYRSVPPKKPIPESWTAPPEIGTDSSYQGPDPFAPIKESPYAMPARRNFIPRFIPRVVEDKRLASFIKRAIKKTDSVALTFEEKELPDWLRKTLPESTFEILGKATPAEAYASLKAKGFTHVVVHRTHPLPKLWIEDEYHTANIRLRENLSTQHFTPLVIGRNFNLFKLVEKPELTQQQKQAITTYVRARLLGKKAEFPGKLPAFIPGDTDLFRVIVSLRARTYSKLFGRKAVRRMGNGTSIQAAFDDAVKRIGEDWSALRNSIKKVYTVQFPEDLSKALPEMQIEIDFIYEMPALTDRSQRRLRHNMELGVDGMYIRKEGKVMYLEPAYALHRNKRTPAQFLSRLLDRYKLTEYYEPSTREVQKLKQTWFDDQSISIGTFRSFTWLERSNAKGVIETFRGVPEVSLSEMTYETAANAVKEGAEWLHRHQSEDGQYGYKYEPNFNEGKRWFPGGNIVRHALNSYTLLLANSVSPDERFVESARKGLEFTLRFLRKEGNRCVICHRDVPAPYYNAKLGAVAVTVLSILKLSEVSDISEYEDVLRCMGEQVLYMQDPNGHFRQYDVPVNHPYYGAESTIPPGQLLMVLARLYGHSKDKRFLVAADKAIPYYMKQWRHLVKQKSKDAIYVDEDRANIIGIIPWMIMAVNDFHRFSPEQKYVDIAFEMQDWVDEFLFFGPERSRFYDYLGANFKVHNELPSISGCQFTEGVTALHDMAKRVGKRVEETREQALMGMRFCMQLQYVDADSSFFLPEPESAKGGFRYHLAATRLRNDYSYHALASISQGLLYINKEDFPDKKPIRIPEYLLSDY